jgi:hypothetical protein
MLSPTEVARSLPSDSAVPPTPVTRPTAPPAPSPRETAPASSSARTSRTPSAPPEFVVALVFSPRLTPYTLSLWIGEFFRGSLNLCSRTLDGFYVGSRLAHILQSHLVRVDGRIPTKGYKLIQVSKSLTALMDPIRFVEQHGIVLEAGRGPGPNLAEAVAGGANTRQLVETQEGTRNLPGNASRTSLRSGSSVSIGRGENYLCSSATLAGYSSFGQFPRQ